MGKHANKPSTSPLPIKFATLHSALPASYTLPWSSIADRLSNPKHLPAKLKALPKKDLVCLELMRAHGVGAKFAERFFDAGARSHADLLKMDGVSIKLTKAQKIGIRLCEEGEMLISREEMKQLEEVLMGAVKAADGRFDGEILGSYRRGVEFSSDM